MAPPPAQCAESRSPVSFRAWAPCRRSQNRTMSRRVVGPIYRLSIDQTAGAVDDRTDHESATLRSTSLKAGVGRRPLRRPDIEFAATAILTLILILTLVMTLTVRSLSRSTSATS